MRPATVTTAIDAPREQVFDYLADIANHPEFTDHFMKDFRLTRLESRGVGAAARFRLSSPLSALGFDVWAELVLAELERPHLIVMEGTAGRIGRIRTSAIYRLTLQDPGMTSVELTLSSEPATATDRLRELFGGRLWLMLQSRRALRRLKFVLEQGEPSAHPVRVAAG